jgi:hypothetical protein
MKLDMPPAVLFLALVLCACQPSANRSPVRSDPAPTQTPRAAFVSRTVAPQSRPTVLAPLREARDRPSIATAGSQLPGKVIKASADLAASPARLGVPYDAQFRPFQGEDGRPLFPEAGPPRVIEVNVAQSQFEVIETEEALAANMSAWGLGGYDPVVAQNQRFASYRAMQVVYILEMNDAQAMRPAPAGAVYYPWRIYYGHSCEWVVSGDAKRFHEGLKADFAAASGEIETFAAGRHLTSRMIARGLVPASSSALFARSGAELRTRYTSSGPAAPVLVEYRQIPNTTGLSQPVHWIEPVEVQVTYTQVFVIDDGTWFSTPWTVHAACRVNGEPTTLPEDLIWIDNRVNQGRAYPVSWSARLSLVPGDRLECGLEGQYQDAATSPALLPSGRMSTPAIVQPGLRASGTFEGKNDKTGYRVSYSIQTLP